MAPILYCMDLSPPVRAVLLTGHALGIELERKEINLKNGDHLTPEYLKMNPQHSVPTLNDDGFCIWDSHAIAAYLVGKYGKDDSLYPKDLQKRAVVDQRLHFDSGILFPRLRDVFYPILFLSQKEIPKEKVDAVLEGLAFLEIFLEDRDWLAGDNMTIADFCNGASVVSLEAVASRAPLGLDGFPRVQAWINHLKEIPYFEEINRLGVQQLELLVNKTMDQ